MPDISVVVLGSGGVGKSCLTIQYVQGHFVDQHDATIEDVYRKTASVDGQPAVLTVVDTAGQDAFEAMRDPYLRKGHGFVLVYSITDAESFESARRLYAHLQRVRAGRPAPCVVVANKADQDAYRAVSAETGAQWAAALRAPFMEVTARDHKAAERVFEQLVRAVRTASAGAGAAAQPSEPAEEKAGGGAATAPTTATPPAPAAASGKKRKRKHHWCAVA